jgi:hypothetical protein
MGRRCLNGLGSQRHRTWEWAALGLVAIGLVGWIGSSLRATPAAAEGVPRLVVSPPVVDFGTIRRAGGKVEATFTLRNDGRAPLRIQRIVPT